MFKPVLLLSVCVSLFLSFFTPLLHAGFTPPKSTDLTVRSLKEENPQLWSALGLDDLGNDDAVLHLAENSDAILSAALNDVINALPQAQITFEAITDPLAGESDSQPVSRIAMELRRRLADSVAADFACLADAFATELQPQSENVPGSGDQTAMQLWSPRTAFQHYFDQARRYYAQLQQIVVRPLTRYYHQARNAVHRITGYCDQFFGQHCPSLFYNPMALVGRRPTVNPAEFPARWLQIREIRDHLLWQWIRINSRYFASRIRRFDNLRLPAYFNWSNVQMRGFSFQGAVIPGHSFSYCQLVDTSLEGTQFYRCSISCSEITGIQTDLQTQLQASLFQQCATQDTITTLLSVTGAGNMEDESWQGLVQRMINIYFISQLQQHVLLQQMVAAISSNLVTEFIEHSRDLINSYPELFSVALQVMYIVSMQNEELTPYRANIQLLMSHYAADALNLLSANDEVDGQSTEAMLGQVMWPETPITLTPQQLDYQDSLMNYMQQHGLQPVTVPKDDQCFYHVLAQHVAETNPNLTQEDKKKRVDLLRQMIASFLFVYFTNVYAQDDPSSEQFPVDNTIQTKMGILDQLLEQGQIDMDLLLGTAAQAAHGWAGQTTAITAAIVLEQPVFMVNDHGPNVHVSLMYPDGTSVSESDAEEAMQSGQVQNVIPIVFDSVNHWFTMIGTMLQTWLVLQGQATK